MTDYWTEHAEIALDEAGLTATPKQIDTIAGVIESAHEFYGQSMGHDVASKNFQSAKDGEIRDLKKELDAERAKVVCSECWGKGWTTSHGPAHSSTSQCFRCKGDGRL